jgi:hypothetical protein
LLNSLFLSVALVLAILAAPASAQGEIYKPWLHDAILEQSTTIVVATFERTTLLPSKEVLNRFKVKKCLKGEAEKSILVIGAERSILRSKQLEKILFLKKSKHGSFEVVVDFVDLPRRDSVNRVNFLEAYLKAIKNPKRSQADAVKKLVMQYLESRSPWIRRVLVRELYRIALLRSDLFTSSDLPKVESLFVGDLAKTEKQILVKTRVAIEEGNALRWTRSKLMFPNQKVRKAYMADLALFDKSKDVKKRLQFMKDSLETFKRKSAPLFARVLNDPIPEVAARAADYLGELESGAGMAELLKLVDSKAPSDVRRAAIVALGKISAPRSADILIRSLQKAEFHREILKGLVSIGTKSSLDTVRAFDVKLRRDANSAPEMRVYLAKILGKDFSEQLYRERRTRKAKYGR